MLKPSYTTKLTEIDQMMFEKLVPKDHILRQFKEVMDYEELREVTKDCYSATKGRGAWDPVVMIKIEQLQFLYGHSDRAVLGQIEVNVAYRYFLGLSLNSKLPSVGLLCQFRQRLGVKRHRAMFEKVVSCARRLGLVKDDLRLKDATHIIADVNIPTTIQLVAQTRERLLRSAKAYAKEQAIAEEQRAKEIRKETAGLKDKERLGRRVEHLRKIVSWVTEVQKGLGATPEKVNPQRQRFDQMLKIAQRVVAEGEHLDQGDRLRSSVDPDARRGKHGDYYDGYQLDISMDMESEIITAVTVSPANNDEAANAVTLIEEEQKAQKNQIKALSIDGIGFRGDILRKLKDPQGLRLQVYVPPREWSNPENGFYPASQFHLEENGSVLVCPNEDETRSRSRNSNETGWQFHFTLGQCKACLLRSACMEKLPSKHGRQVNKNDYEAEYQAARDLAQTPAYALVRKQHPKIERKLAEIIRYHQGRRTRFRGEEWVSVQYLITTMVVNLKRITKLLFAPA